MNWNNASLVAYLQSADHTIYFSGISRPYPEMPKLTPSRNGSAHKMLDAWYGGDNIVSGRTVAMTSGAHESSQVMMVSIPLLDANMTNVLRLMYASAKPMKYSPDYSSVSGAVNEWLVIWHESDDALDVTPIAGFPGYYRIGMKFRVRQKTK